MEDLPPINKIQEAFPGLENLEEIARGGFKVVFKAQIQKKTEIFKIVKLPDMGKTEEHKAYRSECLGRIRREVELLGKCRRPEIVKLGSVAPRTVVIEDEEYIGYSEEYLEGESIRAGIAWELLSYAASTKGLAVYQSGTKAAYHTLPRRPLAALFGG